MFIETEQTPNPATLKFLPGRIVMESGTADFATSAEAVRSPLAERLFQVEGVQRLQARAAFERGVKHFESREASQAVAALREDLHLGVHLRSLQRQVERHAVLGVADGVVRGVHEHERRRVGRRLHRRR